MDLIPASSSTVVLNSRPCGHISLPGQGVLGSIRLDGDAYPIECEWLDERSGTLTKATLGWDGSSSSDGTVGIPCAMANVLGLKEGANVFWKYAKK